MRSRLDINAYMLDYDCYCRKYIVLCSGKPLLSVGKPYFKSLRSSNTKIIIGTLAVKFRTCTIYDDGEIGFCGGVRSCPLSGDAFWNGVGSRSMMYC